MSNPASGERRHDLALPNELLHKVILWVLCDSVHSMCTSTGDTTWEQNTVTVLHQVSPAFKAISSELAGKVFDLPKDVRNDDAAVSRTVREIFIYLNVLGARFRHPSEWGSVSFQTIDCSASPLVFAYALYLSCTSLRRNACRSPCSVFESTHKVILSGIDQSEALCTRIRPVEITWELRKSMDQEHELAVLGLNMVQGFKDLQYYGDALTVFQKDIEKDGTGAIVSARHFIHTALSKVEGAYEKYEDILNRNTPLIEPHAYELPGVVQGLQCLKTLIIDQDQYDLRERIRKLVEVWYGQCPLLNNYKTATVVE